MYESKPYFYGTGRRKHSVARVRLYAGTGTITKMDHGPYMEASVGIENIFKVLRIDYVWRLSYRDVPYEIDRHGIRIAMHVTF